MSCPDVKTIYMMGIGGIAMGTLATMLREKGFQVVGSDVNLYPPMSTHLEEIGIPVCQGYRTENLDRYSPDVVIVGNVIRRDNPEAQAVLKGDVPYLSMPEALGRFFLPFHKSMVVAGTHGKSTTSSLLAWVLANAGGDPSAFVGAFMKNWERSYRLGSGRYMVIEGDEYDTAFFDKGPKFLHYQPHVALITSIEFDHADIFPDFEAVREAFRRFVHLIEPDGYLIVNADDPHCVELSRECRGQVFTYGRSDSADWQLVETSYQPEEVHFTYRDPRSKQLETMVSKLPGRHNVSNTLGVMAAASIAGLSMGQVQDGLLSFRGVKRRQDILGEAGGVLIMDDFAHHPTAVHETIRAIRLFYPDRRIIAAFEPRTNSSRRKVFQDAYATAFDEADLICIKQPPGLEAIPEAERLDAAQLVENIRRRQKEVFYFAETESLLQYMAKHCTSGDLVLSMSNGSFDGFPQRLLKALQS